jgi:hypothetical protein
MMMSFNQTVAVLAFKLPVCYFNCSARFMGVLGGAVV